MKTLEEIKNELAIEKAYDSWNEITFFNNRNVVFIELLMNEVAKRYAKEVAIASLEKASENAKIDILSAESKCVVAIDKYSITNEENIVL